MKKRELYNKVLIPGFSNKKLLLMLNWTITLTLLLVMKVSANSYSQNVKVDLDFQNVKFKKAFAILEQKGNIRLLYSEENLPADKLITLSVKDTPVMDVLGMILKDTKLGFRVLDNGLVVISPQRNEIVEIVVRGQVTDSKGETLPGVSIKLKGTTIGVTTDMDGRYSINVPDNNAVLVFTYIGFNTQEVAVNNQTSLNVKLTEANASLDEVVVVGYGTVKRSDLVGSTSSVSIADINKQPSARVDQVLQGRSPGLAVQNNSAAPNGKFTIRIRGNNSLTGSNDPLVVIDGFIGGDLSSVNPNDIAGIEILKDASSTAIYGSRGANGVILVTTKAGTSDRTTVQYNNFLNFTSVSKRMDLLNAGEYAETVNAHRLDLGLKAPFSATDISNFKTNGGTDWQDVVFRPALQQGHQVSISGGGERVSYYLSGNYNNNEGIIRGSSFRQYAIRSNLESKISSKIKVGLNLLLDNTADHPVITGGNQDNSPTQGAMIWSPTMPVYKADGSYTMPSSSFGPPAVSNPLAMAIEPIRDIFGARNELNTYVNFDIVKGLSAKVQFGARSVNFEDNTYLNTKPKGGLGDAVASINHTKLFVLQNTNQLNYSTNFGKVHDVNITAVYEQQSEKYNNSFAGSNGFSSDLVTYNNLGLGSIPQIPRSGQTRKDIQSFLGRVNYSYRDKYLVSLNSRYDGASVFTNEKWGFFPSAAVAWRVTGENFMSDYSKISNLKLRASYGLTGSQAIGPYSSLSSLNTNLGYPINGSAISTGVGLGTLGNPDLEWEKTEQLNLGFDLGLFNERITFTADYYNKETNDLLMNVPLPRTSGYASILQNIGSVQNKGFELNLGGNPLTGALNWNTSLNYSVNNNKVLALSGANEIAMAGTGFPNMGNTIFLTVGQPIGVLKGYIQDGVWGTAEAAQAATYGSIPGAPKYVDQNKDGKINNGDIAFMGNTVPKFTYGWSNTFSYKSFDLNMLLQGSEGNKVFNLTRIRSERASSDADATDRRILNRWTPENQNTSVPSFKGSNSYEQLQSSRWLEDGSYLRIRNITLGYMLPKSLLSKAKVSSARLFVSGVNLFTFTEYTGFDPEASTNVGTLGGIDMAPYPSQKMYTAGLNVSF